MVDEDVAFVSPSTVHRILKEANLVCPWRRRAKRKKAADERATRPDQRWSTDLMHVQVGGRVYYFVAFLDEYSRYIVHHEMLLGMDGRTVSAAAQKAVASAVTSPAAGMAAMYQSSISPAIEAAVRELPAVPE